MKKIAIRTLLVLLGLIVCLAAYETFAVFRARGRTAAALASVKARPLSLAAFGGRRIAMMLKVEDPSFFQHHGVDFSTPGQGKTTLTEGLVKFLYFDHFKPGFAKIEQTLIARFVLDPAVSKREQLEIAINYASFGTQRGREVRGFTDAARVFYGKPYARLSDHEFLSLVAMLMGPNVLDPIRHPKENADRVARIEKLLAGRCAPQGVSDNAYPACA
ncbi:transglycosylase domain-containing protein [Sphingomonas sp.]|jgi:membrane carboxypeptidase/penicillin-binding protein|uniref:transglycosylase domain-containing protein n=1 Tax=Sphingomonas sp. TaxID=28214 RepID=UPI002E32EF1D|nr:transglycosylase domain-containing protein [Sphingomonas sp.]HEX4693036.1 transglycosylase domain-containing protein [Sphingomonas sp.]